MSTSDDEDTDQIRVPRAYWRRCIGRFTGPLHGALNAQQHFTKHVLTQKEWPNVDLSVPTYVARATSHLNKEDVYEYYDVNDRVIVKYELETNELGLANYEDGHIRTFFRPALGPAYVEQRLQRAEWIPYEQIDGDVELRPRLGDDFIAQSMQAEFDALHHKLASAELNALACVRDWSDNKAISELAMVLSLVIQISYLRNLEWQATQMAATAAQEEVATSIAGRLAEWEGVLAAISDIIGSTLNAAAISEVQEELSRLETEAWRGWEIDRESVESEDLWARRDSVEMLLAHLASRLAPSPELLDAYLDCRVRCELVDLRLKRIHRVNPPLLRLWDPMSWAWWRTSSHR